ncbi:hypothetical protein ACF1AO_30090 [Streptomyces longwoodensis]|uniref:hypothetical protein n=1 Tax=Streptomyces longwoodensis TaxID=68231 RepID=UPI0036FEFF44
MNLRKALTLSSAVLVLGSSIAVAQPAVSASQRNTPAVATADRTPAKAPDDVVRIQSTATWTRSCGTTYQGVSTQKYAETRKFSGGSCKGDAWVRAQRYGVWGSWVHNSSDAIINYGSGITAAQHKGCADCTIYTTYP